MEQFAQQLDLFVASAGGDAEFTVEFCMVRCTLAYGVTVRRVPCGADWVARCSCPRVVAAYRAAVRQFGGAFPGAGVGAVGVVRVYGRLLGLAEGELGRTFTEVLQVEEPHRARGDEAVSSVSTRSRYLPGNGTL